MRNFKNSLQEALKDQYIIEALGDIISSRVKDAIKGYELRLLECEKSLKEKDKTIKSLLNVVNGQCETNRVQADMIDELEQYSRLNSVRIQHPNWVESTAEDCASLVCDYAKENGIDLNPSDIDACHRIGRPSNNNPRPVLVKLIRRDHRTSLLKTRSAQRTARSRVYINEDLTQQRAQAAKCARDLVSNEKLAKSYVLSGKIHIETNEGERLKISCVDQLDSYK